MCWRAAVVGCDPETEDRKHGMLKEKMPQHGRGRGFRQGVSYFQEKISELAIPADSPSNSAACKYRYAGARVFIGFAVTKFSNRLLLTGAFSIVGCNQEAEPQLFLLSHIHSIQESLGDRGYLPRPEIKMSLPSEFRRLFTWT
jgi:hypothetical protein